MDERFEADMIAEINGGACLGLVIDSGRFRWRCGAGHVWDAFLAAVRKHWCLKCTSISEERMALIVSNEHGIRRVVRDWKGVLSEWACPRAHRFTCANRALIARREDAFVCTRCALENDAVERELGCTVENFFDRLWDSVSVDLVDELQRGRAVVAHAEHLRRLRAAEQAAFIEHQRRARELSRECSCPDYDNRGFDSVCRCRG